ncbi:hypothetical protein BDZ85DRAFT_241125 [Elsinoe ampelina]|uniref:Uncharacterized protein n=1 Tax=Elsinoe ampelina TaxID=302913 RepID=A0A6A6G4V4_9PEZI|nr:hypothetical protein BDZ85DRAFT_241125 [Elsinoe ampelina]
MSDNRSKSEIIEERKANLPLPEQPPVASDFNSADERTVNVGSGGISGGFTTGDGDLRDPATGDSGNVGRQGKEGLDGLPSDALASGKKSDDVAETRNPDKGYPHNSDPTGKQ